MSSSARANPGIMSTAAPARRENGEAPEADEEATAHLDGRTSNGQRATEKALSELGESVQRAAPQAVVQVSAALAWKKKSHSCG